MCPAEVPTSATRVSASASNIFECGACAESKKNDAELEGGCVYVCLCVCDSVRVRVHPTSFPITSRCTSCGLLHHTTWSSTRWSTLRSRADVIGKARKATMASISAYQVGLWTRARCMRAMKTQRVKRTQDRDLTLPLGPRLIVLQGSQGREQPLSARPFR